MGNKSPFAACSFAFASLAAAMQRRGLLLLYGVRTPGVTREAFLDLVHDYFWKVSEAFYLDFALDMFSY